MLLTDREEETDLWANAGHTTLEIAELRAGAAVAGELLKEIAGKPDLDVLAHELRGCPVDVKVDAVLVLQGVVHEVVGQAADDGKFMSSLRIEIGVSGTSIERHPTEAEIAKARAIVRAARGYFR